jgi:hypothetical protein
MKRATVSAEGEAITVHVPMTFRKRGGRKLVVTPDGSAWAPRMLDEDVCGTLAELARRERVSCSYLSRVLRLALLAPDIVDAILDGRQPEGMTLEDLLDGCPIEWAGQKQRFGRP